MTRARPAPSLPGGVTVVAAPPPPAAMGGTAAGGGPGTDDATARRVNLDFKEAPVGALVGLLANAMNTPIWSTIAPRRPVDVSIQQGRAIDVLDAVLAQVGATRTEVAAIRIVPDGATDAAALGGAPITATFHQVALAQVLATIEPALAMPIGPPPGPPAGDAGGAPPGGTDLARPVTLELRDGSRPATRARARARRRRAHRRAARKTGARPCGRAARRGVSPGARP